MPFSVTGSYSNARGIKGDKEVVCSKQPKVCEEKNWEADKQR